MTNLIYRGVSYDTDQKPALDRHHGDDLRYRGASYDGYEAERAAAPSRRGERLVYRGVVVRR